MKLSNMLITFIILKLLICAGLLKSYVTPAISSMETKLFKHLFDGYSRDVRPVIDPNTEIIVKIGMQLNQLVDILERDQMIMMKIYIRLEWRNELLKWNPRKWGNISSVEINSDSVWIPDIFLYEEVTQETPKGTRRYQTSIDIHANGTHCWTVPVMIKSSCAMNVREFPFDHQTCTLRFGSWILDETKLKLIIDNRPLVDKAFFINSSEWDLVKASRKLYTRKYPCCPNPYMDIDFTFTFHRKSLYYFLNLIIPCFLLIIIVIFSFFLPSNCIERIGIIITVFLAFVVFLQIIEENLPKTSESTPVLSLLFLTSIVGSAVSIIGTCTVILLYHRGKEEESKPVPEWIRRNILKVSKSVPESGGNVSFENSISQQENNIRLRSAANSPSKLVSELCLMSNMKQKGSNVDEKHKSECTAREWQLLAKMFDRGFLVILISFFVGSFCAILVPPYFKSTHQ